MLIYEYSGTLNGFLCTVFEAWKQREYPDLITDSQCIQIPLAYTLRTVKETSEQAFRIRTGIGNLLGNSGLTEIDQGFSSGRSNRNMILFHWIMALFRYGEKIQKMFSDQRVLDFKQMVSAVSLEIHRMHGFLRFQQTQEGLWFSEYAPDNDITAFLMPHFFRRLPDQPLLLLDRRRNKCGISNTREWKVTTLPENLHLTKTDVEQNLQMFWKQYYKTVNIASRNNSRLQANYLPRRYRSFLPEMEE